MKPIVHGLEAEYWGRVDFIYLDRDKSQNREVAQRFNVRGQPVFLLLEPDGTLVQQWFGGLRAEDIRAALDGYLAGS